MNLSQDTIALSDSPPIRRRVLHGLHKALHWSGAAAVYTHMGAVAGATILMYHSVPGPAERQWIDPANATPVDRFEAQMRFLREHRSVVSLDTLVENLRAGNDLPAGTVVITFDDGYRDNLQVAAPILARYQLPATLYLPTGYVQRQQNQWIDELYNCFRGRERHQLQLEGASVNLHEPAVTRRVYGVISGRLRSCTYLEREQILSQVREQLQPDAQPPRLTLNWDEARELKWNYPLFEVGVHTVDHVDLSEHPRAAQAEISRCISDVEREIGTRPQHFSYPYGRCSDAAREAVIASGLKSAVVGGTQYLINRTCEPFSLCRLAAPDSIALVGFWTSGAYPALSKALFGRA